MNNAKLIINYEKIDYTPHAFDMRLIDEFNKSIWLYDKRGKKTGLNYLKYAQAATILLLRIQNEKSNHE